MRDFLWLVSGVARSAPGVCVLWLAASLLSGALIPAQLWLTKMLVDTLAARLPGGMGGVSLGGALGDASIGLWLALLTAVIVAERVIRGGEVWLSAELREQVGTAVREGVMLRAAELPAASFEDQTYYDRLSRIMRDAEQRVPESVAQTLGIIRRVPHLIGYAVGLFAVSPIFLGVVLLAWAPSVYIFALAGKTHFALLREQTRERRLGTTRATCAGASRPRRCVSISCATTSWGSGRHSTGRRVTLSGR